MTYFIMHKTPACTCLGCAGCAPNGPPEDPVCMVCRGCPPHPLYPYNGGIRPIGCAGDAQGMHRGCTGDAPRGPPEDPATLPNALITLLTRCGLLLWRGVILNMGLNTTLFRGGYRGAAAPRPAAAQHTQRACRWCALSLRACSRVPTEGTTST